jgi:gliding motility-associated-like protein
VLDSNINWVSNDTIICIGDTIQLKALSQSITSNLNIPTYVWAPAESLSTPNNNATLAYPTVTTLYSVTITPNFCFPRTYYVQVTVEPLPAIVTVPGSATVVHGSSIQLLATAPNVIVSDFAWAPGATLSCDTCDNPIATPVTGTTVYTVTAISNFGCIAKDTISIHTFCDNSQIWLPNTFTPNGDGINDRFYISGKGISNISMFRVFNRWGQLIYEKANITTNDPSSGWDGTYKGYVLPPDVFYYQVIGQCELGGEPFTYNGDISIVR